MMVLISMAAAFVAYLWVLNFFELTFSTTEKSIQIQSIALSEDHLAVCIQNIGNGPIELDKDRCLYVQGSPQPAEVDRPVIDEGEIAMLTTTYNPLWASGEVNVKVVTTSGTYAEKTVYNLVSQSEKSSLGQAINY
jgi:hypothetical protein